METSDTWKANATVNMKTVIPNVEKKEIELFSYPELSMSRSQLEFRTFDFTHILTNLRTQILTRGLDSCPKKHFEELSESQPDILSLAAVFDKIDQQNAFTAMRMFNCDVETFMHSKGYVETADFIRIVRNLHNACNKRGISADKRVCALYEMHKFLTHGINFNCVPFQYPGRYIKGITW